jgi:hypothetical protein
MSILDMTSLLVSQHPIASALDTSGERRTHDRTLGESAPTPKDLESWQVSLIRKSAAPCTSVENQRASM